MWSCGLGSALSCPAAPCSPSSPPRHARFVSSFGAISVEPCRPCSSPPRPRAAGARAARAARAAKAGNSEVIHLPHSPLHSSRFRASRSLQQPPAAPSSLQQPPAASSSLQQPHLGPVFDRTAPRPWGLSVKGPSVWTTSNTMEEFDGLERKKEHRKLQWYTTTKLVLVFYPLRS